MSSRTTEKNLKYVKEDEECFRISKSAEQGSNSGKNKQSVAEREENPDREAYEKLLFQNNSSKNLTSEMIEKEL